MFLITLYIFIIGLIFGSFFNVVGLRVPNRQSIVAPRSACPTCHHTLTAKELVPVLSYMWQRGKCANCRAKISSLYPCMELLTGLLFVVSFLLFGFQGEIAIAILLVSLFMIITVSDLAYMLIPNRVLVFFFCLFVVGRFIVPLTLWYDSLLGMAVGFGLLYVVAVVSRGGMGGGDIKLYAVLGYVLGWKVVLLSFFLSTLAGAIGGSVGLLIGKVKRGEPMPFGPYIMVGTLIAYFFYTPIINWYMNLVNL